MSDITTAVVYLTVKRPCLKAENEIIGCLNGGTCFKIPMHNGSKIIGCSCTGDWDGSRCEYRFVDHELWAHDASMVTGITVGLLLLLASIVGVAIYWRRRRRRRRANLHQTNPEVEGSVTGNDDDDQTHGNDHVLVSPGDSKHSYDACSKSKTESRQNLTVDQGTSASHALETEVSRRPENNGITSCSPSSSYS